MKQSNAGPNHNTSLMSMAEGEVSVYESPPQHSSLINDARPGSTAGSFRPTPGQGAQRARIAQVAGRPRTVGGGLGLGSSGSAWKITPNGANHPKGSWMRQKAMAKSKSAGNINSSVNLSQNSLTSLLSNKPSTPAAYNGRR